MPKRIQRKRTKGWRMPEGAIYVGRPTRWGNPYFPGSGIARGYISDDGGLFMPNATPEFATRWFQQALEEQFIPGRGYISLPVFLAPLRGHDLACWCPLSSPCHADVLLELANQ